MKNLLAKCAAICAVLLLTGATNGQNRRDAGDVRDRFAGAWRLASLVDQPGANGATSSAGQFIFTRDGHLSVQVMDRNPRPQTPAGPQQYSQGGYEATWGTYTVDERAHTFTFHVEGALVRTLIGQDLPRKYEFSGNRLIVTSANPDEHFRVVWERY